MMWKNKFLEIALFSSAAIGLADSSVAANTVSYVQEVKTLNRAGANKLLESGLTEAAKQGLNVCIAVVDQAGQLIAFQRMDGASLVAIDVAIGKARTAALLKKPAKAFEEMIDGGSPSLLSVSNLMPLRGGVPVLYEDAFIGAVGVSGGTGETDDAIAVTIAENFAGGR